MTQANIIIGVAIIIINLIPFLLKKPRYLLVTAIISLILVFLLIGKIA